MMTSDNLTPTPGDADLINQCLRGNRDAWDKLITRYERLIFYAALRSGASAEEAKDVFQRVCLIWLTELKHLRDPERMGAWLVTITRRECQAVWRSGRRYDREQAAPTLEPDIREPSPEALVSQAEDARVVRRAMEELPERCKRLLWLLYYHPGEPSYREIAKQLGVSINSVGPKRTRCLEQLKSVLQKYGW